MSAPLTPVDCDLKDFAFIPIEVSRFLDSSFNATLNDTAWRAGVTLWMKAWHQVPAASLPDDDATLANLSGLGRDVKTWRKIKAEAMRGWIKADDGLLYHPVVAEKALEAWLEKLCQRLSSGSGNATRWGASFDPAAIQAQIADAVALLSALNPNSKALAKKRKKPSEPHPGGTATGDDTGVPSGSQEKGQGQGQGQGRDIEGSRASNEALSPSAGESVSEGFSEFVKAYPKAEGRNAALDDWNAAIAAGATPQSILAGLAASKAYWKKEKREERYIPNASAWLEKRGWLDHGVTHTDKPQKRFSDKTVRALVVREQSEEYASSYLDPSEFDGGSMTIIAANGYACDKLKGLSCLGDYRIEKRSAAA